MKWFFTISKTVLLVFIVSCLIRLAYVYVSDSWLIGMGQGGTKGESNGVKKNNSLENDNKKNPVDSYKQPYTGRIENKSENKESNTEKIENGTGNKVNEIASADAGNKDPDSGGYFLTSKEVALINNISLKDKIKGLSILCKVKNDDRNIILNIIRGGITTSEFNELKQVLERNLCSKDIDLLNELLLKNKRLYAEAETGN